MPLVLPYPGQPANGNPLDATPVLGNINALAQAIQSFDGSQIINGSVVAAALTASINPNILRKESFADYVYSTGCVWSAVSGLNGTMTGGTAYISNASSQFRVTVTGVGSHTFTASKDTYVDIDYLGNIYYSEVANGAGAPALIANSIRVAKIVTSGAAITSITQNGTSDSLGNKIYPNHPIQASVLGRIVASGVGPQITATGNLVVTGLGFQPRVIQITGMLDQGDLSSHHIALSIGNYDRIAAQQSCIFGDRASTGGGGYSTTKVISIQAPIGTKIAEGTISATSNDGFTLNIATVAGGTASDWTWIAWA